MQKKSEIPSGGHSFFLQAVKFSCIPVSAQENCASSVKIFKAIFLMADTLPL